jgi:hypothetical protein
MAQVQAAVRVIERARHERDAEVAEGMVEAAAMISPAVARSPRQDARRYEDDLQVALERTGATVKRQVLLAPGRRLDFVVETGGGRKALVEAVARSYGPLTLNDVRNAVSQVDAITGGVEDAGLLIITNAPLSGEVQEFNAQPRDATRPVEVISWNDERDDGILARALVRVAR